MERSEMFRLIMRVASQHGYHPGLGLGVDPVACKLVVESGAAERILRSADFCRAFWALTTPRGDVSTVVAEGRDIEWVRHHRVLQEHPDPLLYCYERVPAVIF